MTVHLKFAANSYVYVCYTTKEREEIHIELLRVLYDDNGLKPDKVLLKINGALGHNGSRLIFDKECFLYQATGDTHFETFVQESTSLNGRVLRMNDDGRISSGNPILNTCLYAQGFRNIQGMTWTPNGNLLTSEHSDAIEDEINWIRPLHNYALGKAIDKDGKSLYQAYCASCHKDDRKGLPSYFPPLVQNPSIENTNKLIKTILHGLTGKIIVKGEQYDQMMPYFNFLKDEELTNIINYVRDHFGNQYKPRDASKIATHH